MVNGKYAYGGHVNLPDYTMPRDLPPQDDPFGEMRLDPRPYYIPEEELIPRSPAEGGQGRNAQPEPNSRDDGFPQLSPDEQQQMRDYIDKRRLEGIPGLDGMREWLNNTGKTLRRPKYADGGFIPAGQNDPAVGSQAWRDMIHEEARRRIEAGESRDSVIGDMHRRIYREMDPSYRKTSYADGGPVPYDPTPEDEFTGLDEARYLGERGLGGASGGLSTYLMDRNQSGTDGRSLEDIQRARIIKDDAYYSDHPWKSTATDIGAPAIGALTGAGLGSKLAGRGLSGAVRMLDSPAYLLAGGAGSLSALNEGLNNPDWSTRSLGTAFALPAATAALMPMALGLGSAGLRSLMKGSPLDEMVPNAHQNWWLKSDRGSQLGEDPSKFPPMKAGDEPSLDDDFFDANAPSAYRKPREEYYPDMPDEPALPVSKPTGEGFKPQSKRDDAVDFYSEDYKIQGGAPGDYDDIRFKTGGWYGRDGRYIPHEKGRIAERLGYPRGRKPQSVPPGKKPDKSTPPERRYGGVALVARRS